MYYVWFDFRNSRDGHVSLAVGFDCVLFLVVRAICLPENLDDAFYSKSALSVFYLALMDASACTSP